MPFLDPPMDNPSPDWIASADSNVHAVQTLDWFYHFTPYESQVVLSDGSTAAVAGVGQAMLVALSPHRNPNERDREERLFLHEVLCIPALEYNIIGCKGNGWTIYPIWLADARGHRVADFDHSKSPHYVNIRRGPDFREMAPSRFGGILNAPRMMSVTWNRRQLRAWTLRPYDDEERSWLVAHGGETAVLRERGHDVELQQEGVVVLVRWEMALERASRALTGSPQSGRLLSAYKDLLLAEMLARTESGPP